MTAGGVLPDSIAMVMGMARLYEECLQNSPHEWSGSEGANVYLFYLLPRGPRTLGPLKACQAAFSCSSGARMHSGELLRVPGWVFD